jgi:hypothetical protein
MYPIKLITQGIAHSIVQDVLSESPEVNAETLATAFRELGIVNETETIIGYEDIHPWIRGGAETYIATGEVKLDNNGGNIRRRFIAKAVVTFPTPPEMAAEEWRRRFKLLTILGVPSPKLYAVHKAVLYQEFLPETLAEAWARADNRLKFELSMQLVAIAAACDACGFHPISYRFDDFRLRNDLLCIVDVGEDLGPWDFTSRESRGFEEWSRSDYIVVDRLDELQQTYRTRFEDTRTRLSGKLDLS